MGGDDGRENDDRGSIRRHRKGMMTEDGGDDRRENAIEAGYDVRGRG